MSDLPTAARPPARAAATPAFIVGCPRSGTTLLASLCDRHSQFAATPETHFFSRFCRSLPRGKSSFPASTLAMLFAESQYTRDLGLSSQALLERTGDLQITVADFFRSALDEFASVRGKPRAVEKTPEHLHHVDEILAWYPDARFVCIVRDGRDTALSLEKMPWATTPLRHFAALWRESALTAERCGDKWPDQFFIIRYEDLLCSPEESLSRVMTFLGFDFEPAQLDAASGTGVVPDWEHGVKKNVFSEIDPSRAYAWRQTATPRQLRIMHSMMGPYLERLGYDPGERVRPSPVIRAYDAALNAVFGLAFSYRLSAVRWWARVILSPMIPSSPHASLTESRRRSENALGR